MTRDRNTELRDYGKPLASRDRNSDKRLLVNYREPG